MEYISQKFIEEFNALEQEMSKGVYLDKNGKIKGLKDPNLARRVEGSIRKTVARLKSAKFKSKVALGKAIRSDAGKKAKIIGIGLTVYIALIWALMRWADKEDRKREDRKEEREERREERNK